MAVANDESGQRSNLGLPLEEALGRGRDELLAEIRHPVVAIDSCFGQQHVRVRTVLPQVVP